MFIDLRMISSLNFQSHYKDLIYVLQNATIRKVQSKCYLLYWSIQNQPSPEIL